MGHKSHVAVYRAVKRGDLAHPTTLECVDCGAPACEYDHRNYHKPLDVVPVCHPCNVQRGAAIPANDCCITYSSSPSRGFVLSHDGIRNLRFEAVDFGPYEEAEKGGFVGADERVDSLNSHDAEFCPGEPLNTTQRI